MAAAETAPDLVWVEQVGQFGTQRLIANFEHVGQAVRQYQHLAQEIGTYTTGRLPSFMQFLQFGRACEGRVVTGTYLGMRVGALPLGAGGTAISSSSKLSVPEP